jgi:Ca2+-binding RTX toxin-like protein
MRRTILLLAAMVLTLLVASGLALAVNKVGSDGPDTLWGTNEADNLVGKGGNDRLFALDGRDNLVGGPGKDWVDTHPTEFRSGDKNLEGGAGNDAVFGGKGSDKVVGNEGNDWLWDGPIGRDVITDRISAGDGNDVVDVYNDPVFKDIVTCGDGFDWVFADRKDVIAPDCERVADRVSEFDELFESIPESFWEGLPPFPEG